MTPCVAENLSVHTWLWCTVFSPFAKVPRRGPGLNVTSHMGWYVSKFDFEVSDMSSNGSWTIVVRCFICMWPQCLNTVAKKMHSAASKVENSGRKDHMRSLKVSAIFHEGLFPKE